MEMMLLSFVGPAIQPEWGLSANQESMISTVAFAGMLVGAYSWGLVSDTYGRKKGFLGSAILTTSAGLLSAIVPNYTLLLILRFLVGIGIGCGHVYSSWFLEFVPTPNRGAWMIVFSTFWTVGTITEASLAWWIMPTYGWRWLLGVSAIPSIMALLFYGLVPESPRYLTTQGRLAEVRQILENGAAANQKELPAGLLVSDHIKIMTYDNEPSESTALLSNGKTSSSQRSSSSVLMLLSPKLIRTTLLLWFLYFANTFAYYGIILLTSQLSAPQSECDTPSLRSENIKDPSLYTNVFITSLAELPGLALAAYILDRVGRKISMEIMLVSGFIIVCIYAPEASLAWWIMPRYGWRWLLGVSAIPSIISLVTYALVPESTRYLCTQGKITEARQILEKGATLNRKELPVGILISDHNTGSSQRSSSSVFMLLSSKLLRTTLLLWFLYFANTFAYYGIILLTSQLSTSKLDCDSGSAKSHSETDINDSSLYVNVFITSLAELPGLALAAYILDRVGRKISMEIMLVSGFLLLLPIVVHQNEVITTGSLFGARMFISASFIIVCIYAPELPGLGLAAILLDRVGRKISMEIMLVSGFVLLLPLIVHQNDMMTTGSLFGARLFVSASFTVACIYAPEVYPTNLRATGVGIATAIGKIGGMVCPLIAVGMSSGCHQTVPVILFEVTILVACLSVVFLPFETKGKELTDTTNLHVPVE
uniref:Putative major facilitator, sugar transporter-like, Major facilitator superfamily domain protein n=1 Tax=Helianthus annuus TaxID=4232 RepID=A0A251TP73_HELAN